MITEELEVVGTINLTPTWRAILPTWLMLFSSACVGDCNDPEKIKDSATKEFFRMADAADKWNIYAPLVSLVSQFTTGEISKAAFFEALFNLERTMREL